MSNLTASGAGDTGRIARPLDDIDLRLVDTLREDGRLSISELAQRVGISRASAYSRFDRLCDEGTIQGFSARVDPQRLGMRIAALVTITAEQHSWRALRDELLAMPEVDYCALCAGEFDLVLLVRAPDIETLRDVVLERLQNMAVIRATRTIVVLDEVVPARSHVR